MIVMVTGLPGSGKSTLAGFLSVRLDLPMLSKDAVKEAVHESIATADPGAVSRASAEVIWRLLPGFPAGAVVDMWFDPIRDAGVGVDGLRRAGCLDDTVEVMCSCPGAVAADRYRRRARSHAHRGPDHETLDRIRRSAPLMVPLGAGPALLVDSTKPFDIDSIVRWLNSHS